MWYLEPWKRHYGNDPERIILNFFEGCLKFTKHLLTWLLRAWLLQYKLGIYNVLYERRGRYSSINMDENKPQKQPTIGASCNYTEHPADFLKWARPNGEQ